MRVPIFHTRNLFASLSLACIDPDKILRFLQIHRHSSPTVRVENSWSKVYIHFIDSQLWIVSTDTDEERLGEEQKPGQAGDRSIRHLLPGSSDCDLHRQGVQILLPLLLPHLERRLLEHLPVERIEDGRNEDEGSGGGSFQTIWFSFRSK